MAKAADYIENVKRYDSGASEAVVQKIVNHLGVALLNKDASLVACSDQTEKDRVVSSWCEKKLGLSGDCAAMVADVCATMKEDRNKCRVTFYYLVAKNAGKLGDL
jgi:hypothetical protein